MIPGSTTKRCPSCLATKAITDFYRNATYCKECSREHNKQWYARHGKKHDQEKNARPETKRRISTQRKIKRRVDPQFRSKEIRANRQQHLKKRFGLTLEQYDLMVKAQNGLCAICKLSNRRRVMERISALAVDHNHLTGQIRGLLCANCNSGLGLLQESIEVLYRAIEYLKKYDQLGIEVQEPGVCGLPTKVITTG